MEPSGGRELESGGFRLLLYATVAAGATVLVLGLVGAVLLGTHPRAGEVVAATGRLVRAGYAGQVGPVAEALREAGCLRTVVLSAEDAAALVEAFGVEHDAALEASDLLVQCRSLTRTGGDRCAELARITSAASASAPQRVLVEVEGVEACRGVYGSDGSLLEDLDADASSG